MSIDEIIKASVSRAGVIRVRNALNPLLWTLPVGPPICFAAAYVFNDDAILRYSLVALGALPLLAVVAAYFLLLFRDPDRLQSEEYILQQQALRIIERKGVPPLIDDSLKVDDGSATTE